MAIDPAPTRAEIEAAEKIVTAQTEADPAQQNYVENRFHRIQQQYNKAFRFGGDVTLPDSLVVSHCVGEQIGAWQDATRHWLEIRQEHTFIRGEPTLYDSPAVIQHEGRTFVAFTGYYDGSLTIEEPLELIRGVDAYPKLPKD